MGIIAKIKSFFRMCWTKVRGWFVKAETETASPEALDALRYNVLEKYNQAQSLMGHLKTVPSVSKTMIAEVEQIFVEALDEQKLASYDEETLTRMYRGFAAANTALADAINAAAQMVDEATAEEAVAVVDEEKIVQEAAEEAQQPAPEAPEKGGRKHIRQMLQRLAEIVPTIEAYVDLLPAGDQTRLMYQDHLNTYDEMNELPMRQIEISRLERLVRIFESDLDTVRNTKLAA